MLNSEYEKILNMWLSNNLRHGYCIEIEVLKKNLQVLRHYNVSHAGIISWTFIMNNISFNRCAPTFSKGIVVLVYTIKAREGVAV